MRYPLPGGPLIAPIAGFAPMPPCNAAASGDAPCAAPGGPIGRRGFIAPPPNPCSACITPGCIFNASSAGIPKSAVALPPAPPSGITGCCFSVSGPLRTGPGSEPGGPGRRCLGGWYGVGPGTLPPPTVRGVLSVGPLIVPPPAGSGFPDNQDARSLCAVPRFCCRYPSARCCACSIASIVAWSPLLLKSRRSNCGHCGRVSFTVSSLRPFRTGRRRCAFACGLILRSCLTLAPP